MKKIILSITCLLLTGCSAKVGPKNLNIDSDHYNRAVHHSMDRQLLLNIVRLRYRDTPTFLQVGIISSSYDFKRAGKSCFEYDDSSYIWKIKPEIGIEYSEKPTTTYSPVRGEGFVSEFLSPVPFETVLLLNSSGWNMDRILRCCVQRINNIRNAPSASGPTPTIAPEYSEFAELSMLLKTLEEQDGVHVVSQRAQEKCAPDFYLVFDPEVAEPSIMHRVWDMLDIEPGTHQVKITPYHGKKHGKNDLMIQTRSPLSIMYFLSHGVHAPWCDELNGLVTITQDQFGEQFSWNNVLNGIMQIHYAKERTVCNAAVLVNYRGYDFYIDDRDLGSKATFSLLSQLLALQTGKPNIPILTLPVVSP